MTGRISTAIEAPAHPKVALRLCRARLGTTDDVVGVIGLSGIRARETAILPMTAATLGPGGHAATLIQSDR
jgi:hypothetical protein